MFWTCVGRCVRHSALGRRIDRMRILWAVAVACLARAQDPGSHDAHAGFGTNYLGYFLSFLGAPLFGYHHAVQTQAESATMRPVTLFSAPTTTTTTTTTAATAAAEAPTTVPRIVNTGSASTFPTSFPTGIVTSFGTFPPPEASMPLVAAGGRVCGCLPLSACVNQTTRSGMSVRIVTPPPDGVLCPGGLVYCCSPNTRALCGLPNVVPGVKPGPGQANLGKYPWSAIILKKDDTYVGGGALVGSRHVLTAAHKLSGLGSGDLKIRLGDWDLSNANEPVRHAEANASAVVCHPEYDAATLENDVAVVTLATPIPVLTSPMPQINTICLPAEGDDFVKSRCWVAGWGKDRFDGTYQEIIKEVDVPVIGHGDCQMRLRATRLGGGFVLDGRSFLCAGGEANKDACTGDGGNALACEKNGQFYVAGITVGGVECGLANVPGLYVNVVNYVSWLNGVMKPSPPPPPPPPPRGIDPRRKPTTP